MTKTTRVGLFVMAERKLFSVCIPSCCRNFVWRMNKGKFR